MKHINKFILLFFALLFSSCNQEEIKYVKNIKIDRINNSYEISLGCYNFIDEDVEYEVFSYKSDDIYSLANISLKDRNYNFRLCDNCFIGTDLISEINNVIRLFIGLKIPITANIFLTNEDIDNNNIKIKNPIYNLDIDENAVSGMIIFTDNHGNNNDAVLFVDGEAVDIIDEQEQKLIKVLRNTTSSLDYIFANEQYFARLDNCHTSFSIINDELQINVCMLLKQYKGINSSIENELTIKHLLKIDLENKIYEIYNNIPVEKMFNLKWYEIQSGVDTNKFKVNLLIL